MSDTFTYFAANLSAAIRKMCFPFLKKPPVWQSSLVLCFKIIIKKSLIKQDLLGKEKNIPGKGDFSSCCESVAGILAFL